MKKYIPYIIFLVIIFVIVFFSLNKAKEEIVTYKTEKGQNIYFYIDQKKFEYNSSITISSENEIIKLTTENYEHDFDSQPIYFKDKKSVLFPNDMSVVFTRNNYVQNKINKYSTIDFDGSYYLNYKNLNYAINDAFLFDGNDTYFFLNETEIKIGDYYYTLSPLSYVIYNHNNELYMYDYDDDKMIYFETVTDNVIATSEFYNIDLKVDSIIYDKGQKLLMKNFDFIKKLK